MGVDSSSWSPPDLSHVWKRLDDDGYAVAADWSVGIREDFRGKFHGKYFNDTQLRHDDGDWPRDRRRARDVIHYTWDGPELTIREYETIALTDRAGIKGTRIHKRIEVLTDPLAADLVRTLLCLVPPERRRPEGTFGINFFRTFTDVVTKPHHDDEEFIILYVMHRQGGGARSYLYRHDQRAEPAGAGQASCGECVLDHQLNAGDLLIFEDALFKHGATPLVPPPGGTAMRDVLVCTVDYPGSYPPARTPGKAGAATAG